MKTILKWVGIVLLLVVVIVVVIAFVMKGKYTKMADATYEVSIPNITVSSDSLSLVRGESLTNSLCTGCHGGDLAGKSFIDDATLGKIHAPNITPGGVCNTYSDDDYIRAIRYGVRPDGTGLLLMPNVVFNSISDEDLGAMVAYLKTVPESDNASLGRELKFPAQMMIGAGMFGDAFYASKLDLTDVSVKTAPMPSTGVDYGEYTAVIHGCQYCHGEQLNGKFAGDPAAPPASNITMGGNFGNWTYEQFAETLWTGTTPEGKSMNPEHMPWDAFRLMSDLEKQAVYNYLQSMPAMPDAEVVVKYKEKMASS